MVTTTIQRAAASQTRPRGRWLNDLHSQLNPTWVSEVRPIRGTASIVRALRAARQRGCAVSVAGGRHAMGGQQLGEGTLHLDLRRHDRVLRFDGERGVVEVESGIFWPRLIAELHRLQGSRPLWGIRQKQTGADRLSLGGTISANGHGRGLAFPPVVADVEALTVVGADGERRRLSRQEDGDLFACVCGGYGLFGVVDTVSLRLMPRRRLERDVAIVSVDDAVTALEARAQRGHLYGDLQLALAPESEDFLSRGVMSTYRPLERCELEQEAAWKGERGKRGEVGGEEPLRLDEEQWKELTYLVHTDKQRAWDVYSAHYLRTSGQRYWSDTHQLGVYLDGYHRELDRRMGTRCRASDVIGEVYVPRPRLADFLGAVREDFRRHRVDCIYSTVRLIERDTDTALPWARQPYACVVFNLHTEHSVEGRSRTAAAFRRLIDLAVERDGSYFLTYHRFARKDQVLACYPGFCKLLEKKMEVDPDERLQSDWYRHHRELLR